MRRQGEGGERGARSARGVEGGPEEDCGTDDGQGTEDWRSEGSVSRRVRPRAHASLSLSVGAQGASSTSMWQVLADHISRFFSTGPRQVSRTRGTGYWQGVQGLRARARAARWCPVRLARDRGGFLVASPPPARPASSASRRRAQTRPPPARRPSCPVPTARVRPRRRPLLPLSPALRRRGCAWSIESHAAHGRGLLSYAST